MLHLRPAYVISLAGAPDVRSPRSGRSALVRIGAATDATQGPAATTAPAETAKMDPKDLGLYVGLPAAGAGVVAFLAGLSAPIAILVGLVGGGAGYFYLDRKNEEDLKAAAVINAKAAIDAKEKERLAKLDVTEVSLQLDEIGLSAKAGLELFGVGFLPGAGATIDWKLASFKVVPTNAVVKQLTDLAKALGEAGYAKAQGQIADAASSAATLRDRGLLVLGGGGEHAITGDGALSTATAPA